MPARATDRPPMPRPGALTPWLRGDPLIAVGAADVDGVLAAAGLPECAPGPDELPTVAGIRPLAPGLALIAAPGAAARLGLWWVGLPCTPRLTGAGACDAAVVLSGPWRDTGRAERLAAHLLACMAEPGVAARARLARSREDLVRALAPVEHAAGDMTLDEADVLALVASNRAGLGGDDARRRRREAGENRLEAVRRRPLGLRLLEQLWSFFALLLWAAGVLAILAGMPELGVAVFLVIVVNAAFSFLQEYRAERALEALERMLPHTVTVRRDGREARIAASELVPGDVVSVEEGDPVPADGFVLEAELLRLDQAALTGEPHPVFKQPAHGRARARTPLDERPERVFAGTAVTSGAGVLLVTATGMATEIGHIAALTQSVAEEASPLQRELARVTRFVTVIAVGFGAAFFALGVTSGLMPPREGFLFALGVIVANVPEGLLPTLTLALALGVQRMAKLGSVVRRLSAVETLGSVNVILTDKTGTLTENRMTAKRVWVAGGAWDLDNETRAAAAGSVEAEAAPPATRAAGVREVLEAAALASVADLEHGDPTERALVAEAIRAGLDVAAARASRPVLAPLPFDSFRKRMTLVRAASPPPAGGAPADTAGIAWAKGAPAELLALCTRLRDGGADRPLEDADRDAFRAEMDRLAKGGMRLLAVAVRALPPGVPIRDVEAVERDFTLLGLVALWDPPRDEVPEAIGLCRRAGIHVAIVTGDYGLTARAIAARIGLPVSRIVTGDEIGRMQPDILREVALEPGVLFARATPADKLAVVQAVRRGGAVVAVTGDGVNDAPALKAADIGVAMGRRGSEVAREAAVMVITDDHFASIVAAIHQGRGIYANIRRFTRYVLASNVPEMVPFLAFALLRVPLPLTVMQVLAVDLGTDLLPALALGAERPEPGVMDRPPRPREERLLSGPLLAHAYAFLGLAEAVLSMAAFFWSQWIDGWRPGLALAGSGPAYLRATTATFAGIVACQVGNVFACRTDRESVFRVGLFSNPLVLWGIAAELALLVALVVVPPFARVFGLAPLPTRAWIPLLAFPLVMVMLEEVRKFVMRKREPAP